MIRALNDVGLSELTKPTHAVTLPSRPDLRPPVIVYNISQDYVTVILDFSKLVLPTLNQGVTVNQSLCGDASTQLQTLLRGPLSSVVVFVSTVQPTVLVDKRTHPVFSGWSTVSHYYLSQGCIYVKWFGKISKTVEMMHSSDKI